MAIASERICSERSVNGIERTRRSNLARLPAISSSFWTLFVGILRCRKKVMHWRSMKAIQPLLYIQFQSAISFLNCMFVVTRLCFEERFKVIYMYSCNHTYLDHDNWGNQIPRIITWFSCDFTYAWTTHFYCITLKPHSTVCLIYLQWCSLMLPIIHPHTWMFAEACC